MRRSRETVLSLFSHLAASPTPLTIAELAQRTGMHRASVYRKVESLLGEGWLTVEGTPRRYAVSWSFRQLGLLALRHHRPNEVVQIRAMELAVALDEPTWYGFYESGLYFTSGTVGFLNGAAILLPSGLCVPPSCVSGGLILLAYQDDAEIERVARLGVPRFTEHTITDAAGIIAHALKSRQMGYAVSDREFMPDLIAFSVPIFGANGAVASVSVRCAESGPTPELLRTANAIAERASLELGYRTPIRSVIG
jgi:DNA-binding IclR family transcriptional regulator